MASAKQLVLDLCDPELWESALLDLSKLIGSSVVGVWSLAENGKRAGGISNVESDGSLRPGALAWVRGEEEGLESYLALILSTKPEARSRRALHMREWASDVAPFADCGTVAEYRDFCRILRDGASTCSELVDGGWKLQGLVVKSRRYRHNKRGKEDVELLWIG
ncbi:hypothetical protein M5K25_026857 [Dendrobium thyrsiflorum]|uniref:Uncharacterized protein n=1 Tax=Dendrobium thyrsiflorum TaxID=117978 RepID=A0ABD0TYA8_DENTH